MRIEIADGVACVRLEAGKANAIGPEFLAALTGLVDELEASAPEAAVFVGQGRAFSAGLDIPALLSLDRAGLGAHMARFNATMRRIFELPFPVVAAVNGHAIAGGCVLAMQADERWMVRAGAKIGLNEVALGIGLPTFVYESFASQVGPEARLRVAQQGALVDAEEALRLGIVHGLAEGAALLEVCVDRARALTALGREGYAHIKRVRRREVCERTDAHGAADDETWLDTWFSAEAQARLGEVAARLKK